MKGATHIRRKHSEGDEFWQMGTLRVLIGCDDGSSYVMERAEDEPATQWEIVERVEPTGQRVQDPNIAPPCVGREMARVIRG